MTAIYVIDPQGQKHTLNATDGWRVMEVIREAGLPMRADCGGCCACATCHVYVDMVWEGKLPAPELEEDGMLDESFHRQENSRLSCQLIVGPEMEGLVVTLAPDAVE